MQGDGCYIAQCQAPAAKQVPVSCSCLYYSYSSLSKAMRATGTKNSSASPLRLKFGYSLQANMQCTKRGMLVS